MNPTIFMVSLSFLLYFSFSHFYLPFLTTLQFLVSLLNPENGEAPHFIIGNHPRVVPHYFSN